MDQLVLSVALVIAIMVVLDRLESRRWRVACARRRRREQQLSARPGAHLAEHSRAGLRRCTTAARRTA
jgi:hypothetical protein